MELPGLKKDLHKSRQETKAVSEILFQSRKDNAELKDQVALGKQTKDIETLTKQHKELQMRIESVTQEGDQNICEVQRLCNLVEKKDAEIQRNRDHCVTLKELVDRLEVRCDN